MDYEKEYNELKEKAQAFVDKVDKITSSDAYVSVFMMAQVHHAPYQGEQWQKELKALKEFLDGKKENEKED